MLSMQGMLAKELKAQGVLPSKFDDLALPTRRNNIGVITDGAQVQLDFNGSYNLCNSKHYTSYGYSLYFTKQSPIKLDPLAELEVTAKMTVNNKKSLYYYNSTFSQYYAFEKMLGVCYNAPDYKKYHYGRSMYIKCCGITKSLSSATPYFRFHSYNQVGNQYSGSSAEKDSKSFAYIYNEPYELRMRFLKEKGDSPIKAYYTTDGTNNWIHALSTDSVLAQEMVEKNASYYVYFDSSYKNSEDNFLYLRDLEIKQNGQYIFQRV